MLQKGAISTNKNVWTFIKPFLTDKGVLEKKTITLTGGNKIVTSGKDPPKTFNCSYIGILKESNVVKSKDISQPNEHLSIQKMSEIPKSC